MTADEAALCDLYHTRDDIFDTFHSPKRMSRSHHCRALQNIAVGGRQDHCVSIIAPVRPVVPPLKARKPAAGGVPNDRKPGRRAPPSPSGVAFGVRMR